MKKCPFCKADIDSSARFCLYCMKPLNEKSVVVTSHKKKPWWLLAMVIATLVVLLVVILLLPKGQHRLPADSAGTSTSAPGSEIPVPTDTRGQMQTDDSTQSKNEPEDQDPGTLQDTPQISTKPVLENTFPFQQEEPSEETTLPSQPEEGTNQATQPEEGTGQDTQPEEGTGQTTQPDEPAKPTIPLCTATYTYRPTEAGDDFDAYYTNPGNHIAITGVATEADNGIYVIPEYIDGQKVVIIAPLAFYGTNVKAVYLPAGVRNVGQYAFQGTALTDIYFTQNVHFDHMALSSSLHKVTVHCPRNCHDRNFWYFSSSYTSVEQYWEEWNG